MKFSLSIPPFVDRGEPDPFRRTHELCALAEAAGFDTLTLGQHHFLPDVVSDPLLVLAAVAARTTTLRLATGIFLLPLHHPVHVAEQVASLDELSGGRAILGVGSGWNPLEYAAFGARVSERGARMEEGLTIVSRLLSEREVAHEGRFWSFPTITLEPRPIQSPRPPLWVAGVAPAAIDRAARLGDAWLCDPVQVYAQVQRLRDIYLESCTASGRTPSWVLRRYVRIGTDRSAIERDWLPGFVDRNLGYWRSSTEGPEERRLFERLDAGEQLSPADIARDRFIWGTPDDVVAEVGRYRELGCDEFGIAFGGGMTTTSWQHRTADDYEDLTAAITLFGREVIDQLR